MARGSEGFDGVSGVLFFASRTIVAVTVTDSGRVLPGLVNCLKGLDLTVSGDDVGDGYAVLGRLIILFILPTSDDADGPRWEVLRRLVKAEVLGEVAGEDGLAGRADSCSSALMR